MIENAPADAVRFVASPLAELGSVLHLLTDPTHHVPFRGVAQRLRDDLPADLADELHRLAPLWTGYRLRLLYPLRAESARTIDDELDDIATLDGRRFFEAMVWAILGGHSTAPPAAAMATDSGRREVHAQARVRGTAAWDLAVAHYLEPEATRRRLLDFLSRMHAATQTQWHQVAGLLAADAHARRDVVSQSGTAAALTGLTPSARLVDNPARVVIDKLHRGVIDLRRGPLLALPSVYGWPHLLAKHEHGWPALVHYPLGPAVAHRQPPSAETMQSRLTALSDPTRMQICRLLAREQLSTSELAHRTGMPPPHVSRALRPLREHGLLTQVRSGHYVYYRLNIEVISHLGSDLAAALLR